MYHNSLGLCDMLTGSAELTLHAFKQIVYDLEAVAGERCGEAVVATIKNSMSDRHIVHKKFNSLLEEYRSQLLLSIVDDWALLSLAEKDHLSSLNNFFCGMHVLVGIADTTSSTLQQWETAHFETPAGVLSQTSLSQALYYAYLQGYVSSSK